MECTYHTLGVKGSQVKVLLDRKMLECSWVVWGGIVCQKIVINLSILNFFERGVEFVRVLSIPHHRHWLADQQLTMWCACHTSK